MTDWFWAQEDIDFLAANAATMTASEVAKAIKTTPGAVYKRAERDGLILKSDAAKVRGGWTEERRAEAARRWNAGESASHIAKEMKAASRCAVLGIVHRMGLSNRPVAARPAALTKPAQLPRPTVAPLYKGDQHASPIKWKLDNIQAGVAAAITYVEPTTTRPPLALVPMEKLGSRHCRWPLGDPRSPSFGFCGAHRSEGATYCGEHAQVATLPRTDRQKKSDKSLFAYVARRSA